MFSSNARSVFILGCFAAASAYAASNNNNSAMMTISVRGGTAAFVANTNVPAISVKGKSTALEAKATLHRENESLQVEHIEARVPVKTLLTGMGVRDEHMRKYVFTTSDGKVPDLAFEGSNSACSGGRQATCQIAGMLSIRGVSRPLSVPLKIREDGGGFKAEGDAIVKLSDYGIEQPSQLGVKTTNDVQLHFDFAAKASTGDQTSGSDK